MQYDKPAIDIARQISQLEARGMIISDKELARHFLSQVTYPNVDPAAMGFPA